MWQQKQSPSTILRSGHLQYKIKSLNFSNCVSYLHRKIREKIRGFQEMKAKNHLTGGTYGHHIVIKHLTNLGLQDNGQGERTCNCTYCEMQQFHNMCNFTEPLIIFTSSIFSSSATFFIIAITSSLYRDNIIKQVRISGTERFLMLIGQKLNM